MEIRSQAVIFRVRSAIGQRFRNGIVLAFPHTLVQRKVDFVSPFASFHPRTIDNNCDQPFRQLRLAAELVEVLVSRKKSVLYGIFRVGVVSPEGERHFDREMGASEK